MVVIVMVPASMMRIAAAIVAFDLMSAVVGIACRLATVAAAIAAAISAAVAAAISAAIAAAISAAVATAISAAITIPVARVADAPEQGYQQHEGHSGATRSGPTVG